MSVRMMLIPADGAKDVKMVQVAEGSGGTADWTACAEILGVQMIERVAVDIEVAMAVDESGMYKDDLQINDRASLLYGAARHGHVVTGDVLLGIEKGHGTPDRGWVDIDADTLFATVKRLLERARR